MISTIRIQEHLELYKKYQIPLKLGERIQFVMNAIDLPATQPKKNIGSEELIVLYVGRSTAEKRVDLIAEVAKTLKEQGKNISFWFMGEVKEAIPVELHRYCRFLGNQSDADAINSIYQQSHILILVSDTEGFPMVVMEAMSHGLAVVSTAVGEVPLHVKDGVNGFLIKDYLDANNVVETAAKDILILDSDRKLLQSIAENNIEYSFHHFGMNRFKKEYQQLFTEMRSSIVP